MSAHLTFKQLPKINDCFNCQGTGVYRWYPLDGGPYYSWMKPEQEICKDCKGVANEQYRAD